MGNAAKRRFVELSVGEVSLVDSAANEEVFAVIKSLNAQEGTMPDDKSVENTATEESTEVAEEKVEKVEVTVEAATNTAIEKAMEKVATVVEDIAKAAGITPAAEESTEDEATEEDAEKAKKAASPFAGTGIRELYMAKLKKAGMKGDELKAAMVDFDKLEAKATEEVKPPWDKTKKDEKGITEESTEESTEVFSVLEQLTAEIEKAKRFTPKRAESLKAAIEQLTKLAGELTDDAQKAQLPGNTQFGETGLTEITKSITELAEGFKAALSEVSDVTKSVATRVEAIEKERGPSQSVNEDGGTDAEVKKEKGLWQGLL